jgi:hypothetical protein
MVRWVLRRGMDVLTCRVDAHLDRARFVVSLVPHRNVAEAAVEPTDTPTRALQRHAEIAMRLRDAGWLMVARSGSR